MTIFGQYRSLAAYYTVNEVAKAISVTGRQKCVYSENFEGYVTPRTINSDLPPEESCSRSSELTPPYTECFREGEACANFGWCRITGLCSSYDLCHPD